MGSRPTVKTELSTISVAAWKACASISSVLCSAAVACRIISRSIGTGCSPAAIMFSWCMSLLAKQ